MESLVGPLKSLETGEVTDPEETLKIINLLTNDFDVSFCMNWSIR
jgi:hypothetical protein